MLWSKKQLVRRRDSTIPAPFSALTSLLCTDAHILICYPRHSLYFRRPYNLVLLSFHYVLTMVFYGLYQSLHNTHTRKTKLGCTATFIFRRKSVQTFKFIGEALHRA
ncbi:hypothetical protein C8Q70DRAFT_124401 [Cubamyces menziesii]|nr:hypothetical protein C8Q70DRAFT_124401 [Cubamyces menziesii]